MYSHKLVLTPDNIQLELGNIEDKKESFHSQIQPVNSPCDEGFQNIEIHDIIWFNGIWMYETAVRDLFNHLSTQFNFSKSATSDRITRLESRLSYPSTLTCVDMMEFVLFDVMATIFPHLFFLNSLGLRRLISLVFYSEDCFRFSNSHPTSLLIWTSELHMKPQVWTFEVSAERLLAVTI